MNVINRLVSGIAETKYASRAIKDGADLSAFKDKPSAQTFFGVSLMCCSYIIGWPAAGLIGAMSIYCDEPLLLVIGCPLLLVIAHLAFVVGLYFAGSKYLFVSFKWAIRVTLEKLMTRDM